MVRSSDRRGPLGPAEAQWEVEKWSTGGHSCRQLESSRSQSGRARKDPDIWSSGHWCFDSLPF